MERRVGALEFHEELACVLVGELVAGLHLVELGDPPLDLDLPLKVGREHLEPVERVEEVCQQRQQPVHRLHFDTDGVHGCDEVLHNLRYSLAVICLSCLVLRCRRDSTFES